MVQRWVKCAFLGTWLFAVEAEARERPGPNVATARDATATYAQIEPRERAALLHADALEAELDGDVEQALRMLRTAHRLAPEDEMVAYDLARLAYETQSVSLIDDTDGFLRLQPTTPDSSLLRAYLWVERGDKKAALEQVNRVLALRPADTEAIGLRRLIAPPKSATATGARFAGRVRTAAEVDSNVTVTPEDQPTNLVGIRALVDGGLLYSIASQRWRADAGLFFSAGAHLRDRADLSLYDSGAAVGLLSGSYQLGAVLTRLDLSATEVLIDTFQAEFMREYRAGLETQYRLGAWSIGLYGAAGMRDFITGNAEGDDTDRDGLRVDAGALVQWKQSNLALIVRSGYLREGAEGSSQRQQGGRADVRVLFQRKPFLVVVGTTYEYRDFFLTESPRRTDHRIIPSAKIAFLITDALSIVGNYVFTRNQSQKAFRYQRHVGQLGVEARW